MANILLPACVRDSMPGPSDSTGILHYALNTAPKGVSVISHRNISTDQSPDAQYTYGEAIIIKRGDNTAIQVFLSLDSGLGNPVVRNTCSSGTWSGWTPYGSVALSINKSYDTDEAKALIRNYIDSLPNNTAVYGTFSTGSVHAFLGVKVNTNYCYIEIFGYDAGTTGYGLKAFRTMTKYGGTWGDWVQDPSTVVDITSFGKATDVTASGGYVKDGRVVTVSIQFTCTSSHTSGSNPPITSLPTSLAGIEAGLSLRNSSNTEIGCRVNSGSIYPNATIAAGTYRICGSYISAS